MSNLHWRRKSEYEEKQLTNYYTGQQQHNLMVQSLQG